ncbi:coth protein-domain-containing protein [Phascolomyces articulosus]|uniref:Coth protein-domain-containing protein n=1 Tax=Phascolomyces articulosus TaxID=60185 RepID=A0AAD5K734_9FUNG|nr:coth protein-domain-containing protein [Phascolomyces articulosus]
MAAAYANAATFKVVAPGAQQEVFVSVHGQRTPLTRNDPDVPFFQGQADCNGSCQYKYVVDGAEETFERSLNGDTTLNDIFQRPITYASLPPLPHPIKENPWTRGGPKGSIWDDQYTPSIFITGEQSEMEDLILNVPKKKVNVKFTLIGPDQVWTFHDTTFRIHGAGKKHNNAKQSWEWWLPQGEFIDNRNWFKLRHMEEDPTQMREKLYADILGAMDTYANRANMVRLFINGVGFGTFNMLDDVTEYSYINAMWYNGNPPAQMGPLYDGASGADFVQYDSDDHYEESWKPNKHSPGGFQPIEDFTEEFAQVDVQDDKQIEEFNKRFDIDQFLRFMVVEYLTADWDGYWMEQTNLGAYCDPTENNRWYYLGQDFDATFGVNLVTPEGRDEFISVSYKDYPERYPKSAMINRLLENTKIRNTFETYLKDTVRILFNDNTLTPRIIAYHNFIAPDLRWDRSIEQLSKGINFGWNFEQTSKNLYEKVSAPNDNGGGADFGLIQWYVFFIFCL